MARQNKYGIAWTEVTWNASRGCSPVSAGCKNCYAQAMANRLKGPGRAYEGLIENNKWNGNVRLVPERLEEPLSWKEPRRVFVNSMSDLFHESLPDEAILLIFDVIRRSQEKHDHVFQILTKRVARMQNFLSRLRIDDAGDGRVFLSDDPDAPGELLAPRLHGLWVGISVENQATADERIPLLLRTPAAVRWLSMEPLLGPVDLTGFEVGLDWVVVGGESGSHCRPMDPGWARSLRDQCEVANIPFFFKQWGSLVPAQVHGGPEGTFKRVSRKRIGMAGKMLDGRTHEAYPHQGSMAPAPEAHLEM